MRYKNGVDAIPLLGNEIPTSTFMDLNAWKESCALYQAVYKAASCDRNIRISPRHDGLSSRFHRIERKDYIHFLFMARGAAYEAKAQLIACADLELIDRNTLKSLYSQTVKVIHLFNALIKALKKVIPKPSTCFTYQCLTVIHIKRSFSLERTRNRLTRAMASPE